MNETLKNRLRLWLSRPVKTNSSVEVAAVKPTADGCWVFASVGGASGGIAVLKRQPGHVEMVRVVPVAPAPAGIVLTHDGKLLIAAANNAAVVLDVARMTAGAPNPVLGTFSGRDGKFQGCVYENPERIVGSCVHQLSI